MQNPGLNAHGGALQAWLAASGLYNGGASNGLSERRLPVGLHEMVAAHAAMTAHPSFAQGSSLLSSRLPSRPNNGAPLAATEAAAAALSAVAAGTLGAGGLGGAPAASTSADSLHSDSSLGSSVGTAAGAIDPLRRRQLLQQQHQQRSHQLLQQLPGGNSMFRPDAPSEAPAVAATLATLDDVTGGADDALGGVEGRYETHMLRMVEACRMRAHCLRLEPGDDLLAKLRAFVVERQIDAAVVLTCVGSTATTTLRPAAAAAPKVFEGAHDIVSLTGTIGRAGHNLRLSVCDEECRVVGGHAMEGCLVRTTAEVCLGCAAAAAAAPSAPSLPPSPSTPPRPRPPSLPSRFPLPVALLHPPRPPPPPRLPSAASSTASPSFVATTPAPATPSSPSRLPTAAARPAARRRPRSSPRARRRRSGGRRTPST